MIQYSSLRQFLNSHYTQNTDATETTQLSPSKTIIIIINIQARLTSNYLTYIIIILQPYTQFL